MPIALRRRARPDLAQEALLAGVLSGRTTARAQAILSAADVCVLAGALDALAVGVPRGRPRNWRKQNGRPRERSGSRQGRESAGVVVAVVVVNGRSARHELVLP